jgi:hypothetical protein
MRVRAPAVRSSARTGNATTLTIPPCTRKRSLLEGLSEQKIQRAVIAHLTARPSPNLWWCAVPNGGFRRPTEAAILSGLGLRKGAPDLIFIRKGRVYGLELKRVGGRPSEAQLECLAAMDRAGAFTCIAEGLDAAIRVLEEWNILRRGRS